MEGETRGWRSRLWPRVPAAIADELALVRVARLQVLVPILYATLIAVVAVAMLAASGEAHWLIRYGMPLTAIAGSAVRLVHWLRSRSRPMTAARARRLVARLALIAVPIAALCGAWTAANWLLAEPVQRSYYPMFMVMGTLTTAFCLASVRGATLAVLGAGLTPVIGALLVTGNRMDQLAVAIILLAFAFLIRLVFDQHAQQVEMLLLRRRLQRQAMTDPLTGLANRRALHLAADEIFAESESGPALVLLDLDGFKPVNDRHGHAAGDRLLIAIGGRLRAHAGEGAIVARIGGDEFAILLPDCDIAALEVRASALLAALAPPFPIDGQPIRIGATAGLACSPADGLTLLDLMRSADAALYAAKPPRDAAPVSAASSPPLPPAVATRPMRSRAAQR